MKTMKKMQQGFTLIELMIVVAIIGILAAIAIPQYQDYITRSKWAGNITTIGSLKAAIAECLQNNAGTLTACDTLGELTTQTGYAALPTATTDLASVTLTANTAAIVLTGTTSTKSCVVTVTPTIDANKISWVAVNASTPAGCTKASTGFTTS